MRIASLTILLLLAAPHLYGQEGPTNPQTYDLEMVVDRRNDVWLATYPGVKRISADSLTWFSSRNGLAHDSVTTIREDGDGRIWIGTVDGISLFHRQQFRNMSYKDGLLNKRVHKIFVSESGDIWIATDGGAHVYRDNRFFIFEPTRNAPIFDIAESESEWVLLTRDGLSRFAKQRHFWRSPWFRFGTAGVGVISLALLGLALTGKLKSSRSLEFELRQIEQRALLAQMNPHFVFNALNSIQKFIMNNDGESAQDYLSKFSTLIRAVLENSRRTSLPLAEELKILKLYLQLEALRFGDGFDYDIQVTPEEICHFEIPTMLLQPFVENAVWHGLMNQDIPGKISLRFGSRGDAIVCEVEDNGVGRKEAAAIQSQHASRRRGRGTQIVQERIELLNRKRRAKIKLATVDLANESTGASGTLVRLEIPTSYR